MSYQQGQGYPPQQYPPGQYPPPPQPGYGPPPPQWQQPQPQYYPPPQPPPREEDECSKLRFEFTVRSLQTDTKTNIITITSIETEENEIFSIPNDMQNISYHEKIQTTAAFQKVKRVLTKRGTTRKVWIADEDILKVYMDEYGNIQFNDFLLEQQSIQWRESLTSTPGISLDTLEHILERVSKSNETQCIESFNKKKYQNNL
ncbi:uncharacterized protein LOC114328225 [Diabrotica virgifera virgifera]|uniref:Uncharacterized protein n=1 Tax=Diabrotica virgifera virgifera TaxID=50390 RepID=A0ABM5IHD9_DIAVI|nr:uncharacterized protein LOC114328225 [Diabrotica virgifera virgifera]